MKPLPLPRALREMPVRALLLVLITGLIAALFWPIGFVGAMAWRGLVIGACACDSALEWASAEISSWDAD